MTAVASALAETTRQLRAAGVENGAREARLLLANVLGLDQSAVLSRPDRSLDEAAQRRLTALTVRRAKHEPLSRISGRREFWSLTFRVGPATLDPRPDSETLVGAALDRAADRLAPRRVLDLGTGTGCLLLAVLHELPAATGLGIDLQPGAVELARQNAADLGLAGRAEFKVGNWGDGIAEQFDLLLCNPPYVPAGEIDGLAPEVALFEPRLALAGGADGLDCFRQLVPQCGRLLAPDGHAVIEIGDGQMAPVAEILAACDLAVIERRADLAGRPRCLVVGRPATARDEPLRASPRPKKTVGKPPVPQ